MFFKNRAILSFLLILLIIAITGCGTGQKSSSTENESEAEAELEAVAMVNGVHITRAEFNATLDQYKLQGIDLNTLEEAEVALLEEQVIDQLVNNELLLQVAEKNDYSVSAEEVETNLAEIKSQFETDEDFNQALESNNITLDELEAQLKKELLITSFLKDHTGEITVTEDEIQELYDRYAEQSEEELPELEEVKDQLELMILQEKEQEEIQTILGKLKEENEIEILI